MLERFCLVPLSQRFVRDSPFSISLLMPGFPQLKEQAYAGIFFELTGALALGIVSDGDPGTFIWPPAILAIITLASWALRPQGRILGGLFPVRRSAQLFACCDW